MSWKPVVKTASDSDWVGNGLRFATEKEARDNSRDLSQRWMAVTGHSALESDEPVNYEYSTGQLVAVERKEEVSGAS